MLHFANGDRLKGQLVRMENGLLYWKSPTLQKETPFFLHQIQDITFPQVPTQTPHHDHAAHIRFNPDLRQQNENISGDILNGELVAVHQDHILLNTWYAGQLNLNRNMVKDLEITDVSPPVYSGPLKADEWKISPDDSWTFEKNTYTGNGNGAIAKDFKKIPERYCFRFTATWKNRFSLQIYFSADSIDQETPDNHYMLMLDNGTSYLQKRSSNADVLAGMMRNGGMIGEYKRDQTFRNKEKTEMRLFVDSTSGLMALYSDETLVQEWNDVEKPLLNGSCIHLRQNSGNGNKIQISRMSLTAWDGILPSAQDGQKSNPIDNPDPKDDEQRVILRNGDIVLGKVEKIENSEIALKTRYNDIRLPVSRIRKLALAPSEYDERLLQNGDVRAWFADGNYVTFRLDGIADGGKITGTSQHFGTAQFDPSAFTRIEFNIYPSPMKD
ncbi:MAG: hypothetical protein RI957_1432 [Verrucomicrobiota bacterium]